MKYYVFIIVREAMQSDEASLSCRQVLLLVQLFANYINGLRIKVAVAPIVKVMSCFENNVSIIFDV